MKKYIVFLSAALLMLAGCKTKDDVSDKHTVHFVVDLLATSTEDMSPARVAASDITLDQASMTDLWVLEGSELLAHQHVGDDGWGSPSIELSYGNHSLTFIASSQSGQQVVSGVWSADKANDAFGAVKSVTVDGLTGAQAVVLQRCSYGIKWQALDPLPSSCKKLRISIDPHMKAMSAGLNGESGSTEVFEYSLAGYAGTAISVSVYGIPAQYGVESNVSSTISFLGDGDVVLYTHTKTVPVLSNRRTVISGALFSVSSSAAVRVQSSWLDDYETEL